MTKAAPPADALPAQAAPRLPASAWAMGLLGVVLFALTVPMTRLAVGPAQDPQLSAAFVTFGRAAAAGLLSLLYLAAVRAPRPAAAQWPLLAATAAGVVFGFPLCLALALRHVDAAHASVVTGVLPIATAALGALWLRQRPGAAFWLAALLGLALVLGFAAWRGGARITVADALLLAAVLSASSGYVGGARLSAKTPGVPPPLAPEAVICWVLVLALPLTLPLALWNWPAQPVRAASWWALAYVAVCSMWLGFFAWYRALAAGDAVRVSQVQLLQPFLSVWFAVPLLGEPLDAPTIAFTLAVMATVGLARRAGAAPPARPSVASAPGRPAATTKETT